MSFEALAGIVAIIAGAIAAVAGFGIGSILTPLLSVPLNTKLAVAVVSIPHAVATALRLWMLRGHVNRRVFWSFGVMSAAGGLAGAALHSLAASPALTLVFALLLVFAGLAALTGSTQRLRFGRRAAWVAGGLSGIFGGLVGNQGGIRSAALLGFDVPKSEFVATATAIALFVDGARLPVYLATEWQGLVNAGWMMAFCTAGVVVGTLVGTELLARVPETIFRRTVASIILALGVFMLFRANAG